MAMSSTTGPFWRGIPRQKGLFPTPGSVEPHRGIELSVFVQHRATYPARAACQA